MPRGKLRPTLEEVKVLRAEDQDFLRPLIQAVLQEPLGSGDDRGAGRREGASGRRRASGRGAVAG